MRELPSGTVAAAAGQRGSPDFGLLAHVPVSRYRNHLPLYRGRRIVVREGVGLDRSSLVGHLARRQAAARPLERNRFENCGKADTVARRNRADRLAPPVAPDNTFAKVVRMSSGIHADLLFKGDYKEGLTKANGSAFWLDADAMAAQACFQASTARYPHDRRNLTPFVEDGVLLAFPRHRSNLLNLYEGWLGNGHA